MNLIIGRQGTGKTTVVYNQIQRALSEGKENLLLIVPEQYTLEAEREIINVLQVPGILHVEVISFSKLMQRIMEEVGGIIRTRLTNTGKQMVIQKIINDKGDTLVTYGGVVNKLGLLEGLEEIISSMGKKSIDIETIENLLDEGNLDNEMLENKLKDIISIARAYKSWLGNDYMDGESIIEHVIQNISKSTFIRNTHIWIDGFHTYTEQVYRLIGELMIYANSVTITLTHPIDLFTKDKDIFSINIKTKDKLCEMAKNQFKIIECYYKQDKSKEILTIEEKLFAYSPNKYLDGISDIGIYQCKDIYREMDELCLYIINLVQENKYRWKDICILTNNLNNYEFLIKRYTQEYGIPCFMDTKKSISDKPLPILLINTLKVILYNYPYEEIFSLIKSGLIDLTMEGYEKLENYILKYGIKGYEWVKDFYKLMDEDIYDLNELNNMRRAIIEPIEKLKVAIKTNPTVYNISSALFQYIRDLGIEEKIDCQINELKESQQWEYAGEYSQIYNMIIQIFDEFVEIFGDNPMDLKEYLRLFEIGIQSVKLSIIPSTLDQVFVGDITRSRNASVKVTCIVGVNEGIIPGQWVSNNIITDYESNILKDKGIEIIDDSSYQGVQEQYLLYNILSRSRDKIFLSYPLADYEGNSLKPSIYIEEIKNIFPKLEENSQGQDDNKSITYGNGTLKHMVAYYRDAIKNCDIGENSYDQAYLWFYENVDYRNTINNLKGAFDYSNELSKLNPQLLDRIYPSVLSTSVSRLEKYVQCPFKHFVHYALKPKEREVYQVSIPDIGELLHKAIQEYTIRLNVEDLEWGSVDEETMIVICNEIIDNITRDYKKGIFDTNPRYRYLKGYLKRLFYRSISVLSHHYRQGKFNIWAYEMEFGRGKEIPPISIDISNDKRIVLEGRIDRIDMYTRDNKHYFKILDFKTGDKELSLVDIYYGLSLQLSVYMWACLNYGRDKSWETIPAGMFYFKMSDPLIPTDEKDTQIINNEITKALRLQGIMLKDEELYRDIDSLAGEGNVLQYKIKKDGSLSEASKGLMDETSINELMNYLDNEIKDIGREIFSGDITVKPAKTNNWEACQYCIYKSICFFDPQIGGNQYKYIKNLGEDEVIKLIHEKNLELNMDKDNR